MSQYGIPFSAKDSFNPDVQVNTTTEFITDVVTVAVGQNLKAGSVLGEITATGQCVKSEKAAADGSEKPIYLLADDCDATAGASPALVYVFGGFTDAFLTRAGLGAGWTLAELKRELRKVGLYFSKLQTA